MRTLNPTTTPKAQQVYWRNGGGYAGTIVHFVCPAPGSTRMRVRIRPSIGRPLTLVFYADALEVR